MIGIVGVAEQSPVLRRAVILGGLGCFAFYALFPAVGPAWFNPLTGEAFAMTPSNCMPSMHFGWALLLALNARLPKMQIMFWGYAALIAIATVGLGQHYLVDLIAAVLCFRRAGRQPYV